MTAAVQDWLDASGANATPRLAADVVKSLYPLCLVPFDNDTPLFLDGCKVEPTNIIAFENGLLDITNIGGKLRMDPHTPNWFSTSCLPYRFEVKAECPQWLSFLGETLDEKS